MQWPLRRARRVEASLWTAVWVGSWAPCQDSTQTRFTYLHALIRACLGPRRTEAPHAALYAQYGPLPSGLGRRPSVSPADGHGRRSAGVPAEILLAHLASTPMAPLRMVDTTAACVDVSDFTRLSERLARDGRAPKASRSSPVMAGKAHPVEALSFGVGASRPAPGRGGRRTPLALGRPDRGARGDARRRERHSLRDRLAHGAGPAYGR